MYCKKRDTCTLTKKEHAHKKGATNEKYIDHHGFPHVGRVEDGVVSCFTVSLSMLSDRYSPSPAAIMPQTSNVSGKMTPHPKEQP